MSSPVRKPSCLKHRTAGPSSPTEARSRNSIPASVGGSSEMLPYAQANVHFPTAKRELVKTRVTHSPSSYDRSPIVVLPNSCALPARGCPGRTYDPTPVSPCGRAMHPLAHAASAPLSQSPTRIRRPATPCPMPGLIPDESSSDDSDGLISPPPERVGTALTYSPVSFEPTDDSDRALLFASTRSRTSSPVKTKSRRSSREYRLSPSAGFDSSDEGCLGGF